MDAAEENVGWIGAGADGAVEEDQLADVQRGVVGREGGDAGYGVGAGDEGGWVGVLGEISMEWWGGWECNVGGVEGWCTFRVPS